MAQQHTSADGERIITARYAGRCRTCPNPIAPGQTVAHGRNGVRCMACVDGMDFVKPRQAPQRYGPLDANGRPIEPTPKPQPTTASRPARRKRTYEELFPEDGD